jgi:hypothetical protein
VRKRVVQPVPTVPIVPSDIAMKEEITEPGDIPIPRNMAGTEEE